MPKLSDTMEEGKIIRWLKHRGDKVAIGDILAEVETDKANMEIEAFDEGVLTDIRTAEGEAAPVGGVIAVLGDAAAASKDGEQRPAAETKAPVPHAAKAERPEPARREPPDEEDPEPERREPPDDGRARAGRGPA